MNSFRQYVEEAVCQMGLNRSVKRGNLDRKRQQIKLLLSRAKTPAQREALKRRLKKIHHLARNI